MFLTMHFQFVLHIGPNCRTISSSYSGGLTNSHLRGLGYNSTIARVHVLSVNLEICLAEWNFCFRYSAITSFTPLLN